MTDRAGGVAQTGPGRSASFGMSVHDQRDVQVVARATASELQRALDLQHVAMVVWRPEDGRIVLANSRAADLVGRPLDKLIGSNATDFVGPEYKVETAKQILSTGVVDAYGGRRTLRGQENDVLYVWARAIDVDGQRLAITVIALGSELAALGKFGSSSPLGVSVDVAVGVIDPKWEIVTVSSDLKEIIGLEPADLRGSSLLDLLAPEDAARVRESEREGPAKPISMYPVLLREPNDASPDLCLLVGEPCIGARLGERVFAFVGWPRGVRLGSTARERELEQRLRRISAEVRAAGLIELLGESDVPSSALGGELTTRQFEIVEMLLRGARVATIARTLYISPSTVRNHLSTIYRHFNVHSQAELLELLRVAQVPGAGGTSEREVPPESGNPAEA